MSINISNDQNDPFFRYKMPVLQVKHEGRGNGVKTVLSNLDSIAKSLNRSKDDLLQYIASELSVCSVYKNGFSIINGTFPGATLQEILSRYISSHVLCGVCDNPETVFICGKGEKKDTLYKTCSACGEVSVVSGHKINKKIIARLAIGGKPDKSDLKCVKSK